MWEKAPVDDILVAAQERRHLKAIYGGKLTKKLCHTLNRLWFGRASSKEVAYAMHKARKAYKAHQERTN